MYDDTGDYGRAQPSVDLKGALSDLTGATIRLAKALFALDNDHGRRLQDACRAALRPLVVARVLNQQSLVAVAGPQGVGKTSVVQALYELDEWLEPDLGQGELMPVFVVEDETVPEPVGRLITFADLLDTGDSQTGPGQPTDPDTFATALWGKNPEVLYPEIRVPTRYFGDLPSGTAGVMLLPGYEKVDDDSLPENRLWQEFMREALTGAAAVVLVTTVSTMATTEANQAMADLRERLLQGASPLVVVNGCDDPDDDQEAVAAQRATAAKAFETEPDRIACVWSTGLDLDVTEVGKLLQRVEPGRGASPAVRSRALEDRVRKDLGTLFDQIGHAVADGEEQLRYDGGEHQLQAILTPFDAASQDLRNRFQARLDRVLHGASNAASARAGVLLDREREGFANICRNFKATDGWTKQSAIASARQSLVMRSWHGEDLAKPSQMARAMPALVGDLTRERLLAYGISDLLRPAGNQLEPGAADAGTGAAAQTGSPADPAVARAMNMLLMGERPHDDPASQAALQTAVELLPAVALEWASLAAAEPSIVGLNRATLEPTDDASAQRGLDEFSSRLQGLTSAQEDVVRSLATIAGLGAKSQGITSLPALVQAVRGSRAVATSAAARIAGGAAAAMIGLTVFDMVRRRLLDERRMVFDALHGLEQAERDVRIQAFDDLMALTREIVQRAGRRAYHLDETYGRIEWLRWSLAQCRLHRAHLLDALGAGLDPLG